LLPGVLGFGAFGPRPAAQTNPPSQINPPAIPPSLTASAATGLSKPDPVNQRKILQGYGRLPLNFEANEGQTDDKVKFLSRGGGHTLFLTLTDAVLALREPILAEHKGTRVAVPSKLAASERASRITALRMRLVGADPKAKILGAEELPGKTNYFIGNDPKKWRTNVPTYAEVKYESVYPGVDLVYYGNQGQLECDFVLAPGADPRAISLTFSGARRVRLDRQTGDLILKTRTGEVRFHAPAIYQLSSTSQEAQSASKTTIDGHYGLTHHHLTFEVASYDRTRPLVIDPALSYSTFLGGSGTDVADSIAVDASGNAYVTGYTDSSDFPTTLGAFQTTCGGSCSQYHAFVTKLNSTGSGLVFSSYLGGSSLDNGSGIALDALGDAYVTGYTLSSDFPITSGAFQTTYGGGGDSFVTELNPSGSALIYSTYLGGSNVDTPSGIAVDRSGDAYVTGQTASANLPVTVGAFQATCPGGCSNGIGFVTKLNPAGSALVYSTYLGGSFNDAPSGIALDNAGDAYITGFAGSTDFPTTPGVFDTSCSSCSGDTPDAFVTELNPSGSGLVYSTYLGGSALDYGTGIAVANSGQAYVTGLTESTDFPTTSGAFQTTCYDCDPSHYSGAAFVTALNPSGSGLVYSTYLSGNGGDYGSAIAEDASGDAYVTGSTGSSNFPTTPGAFQTIPPGRDSFVTELNPNGSALVYSTYLGGSGADAGTGISVDATDNFYVTGDTYSADFPVTPGSFQMKCGGACAGLDAFVTKFVAGDQVWPLTLNFGNQTIGTTSPSQTASLSNSGTTTLNITGISLTGANSADFTQTNTCGTSLAAGATCTITLTFTPSIAAAEAASVTIADNAPNSPQTVALSGTGTLPTVSLSPSSLNFGNQLLGIVSSPQTVTLSTNGPLIISSITTNAQFAQTNNCGSSLGAGASCIIMVTFTPMALGLQNGTLTVSDNGASSPQTTVLSGTGVQPAVTLTPTSLTYPDQTVFTTSKAQIVTLSNTGAATLTISSVAVTGQFSQTNTCGTTVAPGANCTISVTFKPKNRGTLTGTVAVTDNAPGSPQTVAFTGTGTYVELSTTSLNFGSQPVGTMSLPRKITLTNKGSVAMSITAISITGADPGDFAQADTCGSSVAAGASCFIKVTFTPSAKGKRTAGVSVTDYGGGSPQKVSLTGLGT
jgi:Beta-propeller repeat/Abnormal spindle-like microcephaly-assoc'd, ASPM-SPD-2-Hydin